MRPDRHSVIAIALAVALLSLGLRLTPSAAAVRLKVAATIFPLYDLVRHVAAPDVEVVLLVPPGASPHTVAFKPSMIRDLTGSAAIFAIGHGLDDWAARLAREAGVDQSMVVDAGIALREGAHTGDRHSPEHDREGHSGEVDPHYWLSITNAMHMVQTIAAVLGQLDPAGKSRYRQRAAAYEQELREADNEIRQLFAAVPRREVAFFHPAFSYFAATYDLHIVATFEPSPGREPGPRHVEAFLRQIQARKLRVLFIESQLDAGPLRSLGRDLGVILQELDPLGGRKGRESYIAMMRFNATQIAASLRE